MRFGFPCTAIPETFGNFQQAFGSVCTTIEHHIFAGLAQFRINRVINGELTGIDDAHIHANLNGMIEEDSMHRFAHRLIATERERQIGNTAGNMGVRQG